jgi:DNA-binding transcriptional regulator YiaG
MAGRSSAQWDSARVRQLRRSLGLTQRGLADKLGVRQQTVSEWETGAYRPRGAAARLLDIVAENAAPYGRREDDDVAPEPQP